MWVWGGNAPPALRLGHRSASSLVDVARPAALSHWLTSQVGHPTTYRTAGAGKPTPALEKLHSRAHQSAKTTWAPLSSSL